MVKERSYKILEQLDEFELQEAGESSAAAYHDGAEHGLTREQNANAVPSAMDSDVGEDSDGDDDDGFDDAVVEEARGNAEPGASARAAPSLPVRAAGEGSGSSHQPELRPPTSSATAPSAAAQQTVPNPTDGVFANLAARPELYLGYDDKVPNEALPTYQDIYGPQSNSAPPYFETAVISVGDEDELLVEGLPVGSIGVFVVNLVVSTAFQIVGYMLTFLLHGSHAAKNGSLAGLGITFMNFGFYIRTHLGQNIFDDPNPANPGQPGKGGNNGPNDSDTPLDNKYFAYLLIFVGAGIFLKAMFDYIRVRRLQTIIESSPEQNV
ncbi:hypothetical protein GGI04_004677 [Coemansia thaxteri]|uniref:Metal homeostatis protein bsd2 n=1 Tax=Coemansia thaxteri TaxID=2663907 RepID=A0A9W8BCZ2_9FUNG|nr:hypothetical protein GGI04_004677 [Coemansia thaxteri]KAJ2002744.1 hypothetical protein H4R26_003453 [Coemansia thaxteri]KAJ2464385.1 hypothetical protein GGI02_005003 [Coemansia sp. RSA 2322]KAJ2483323.1 hypothetical protein EV174_002979 [Coemansia sp. RSA 2320]